MPAHTPFLGTEMWWRGRRVNEVRTPAGGERRFGGPGEIQGLGISIVLNASVITERRDHRVLGGGPLLRSETRRHVRRVDPMRVPAGRMGLYIDAACHQKRSR